MTLINLTVSSVNRSLVPWTVIQVETGLTFSELFAKLLAGSHPMIRVNEGMSGSSLEKVFVGQSKESISVVDKQLILDDVCKLFGQHIKFNVVQLISPVEISDPQPLRNAFTVLMNSQRALDEKKLPSRVEARTRKEKLSLILYLCLNREIGNGLLVVILMEGDSYLLYRSASGILMGTSKLSLIAVILFLRSFSRI